MELALANAFREALDDMRHEKPEYGIVRDGTESASILAIKGPYVSFGLAVFYVDLDNGKTYTVTVDGR